MAGKDIVPVEKRTSVKIQLEHVSKSFDGVEGRVKVLDDISMQVADKEFVVLLGPGQCGKTTLLNTIAGINRPDSGTIQVDGKAVSDPGPDRGMVFQKYVLFPWKTVLNNVAFGLYIQGVGRSEREAAARKYIDLVGLNGFENAYPHQLSGGMKQRVGIARAYTNNPKVLLMDEPFGALDAQTRYAMEEEVINIWDQEKRTVIFVTNNIEEAIYLGDRVIVMSKLPGTIKKEFVIEEPRPRNYTDHFFLSMRKEISEYTDFAL